MARKGQTKRKDKDRIVLKKGECQRSNGTYHYCWTDSNGKRHFVYAPTLEKLREKELAIEKDRLDGISAEGMYLTINDLFNMWCKIKRGLKDNTFELYKYMYHNLIEPYLGKARVCNLKKSDVKRLYNLLAEEKELHIRTINIAHSVLRQMLDLAVDDGYIRNNPTNNVLKDLKHAHMFSVTKRPSLTKAEQALLLKFLRNHPQYCHWYPIFAVLVGTGLRVGEVTGLRWCDIDMDEGIIDVNHTLVYYSHREKNEQSSCYFSINTPKTNSGKRQVPMLDFVKEAFIMERNYQHSRGLSCNVTVDGYSDFIFINRLGATHCHGTLNKAIQRIVKRCNDEVSRQGNADPVFLPQFSCHSLRHTFTTRMCEAGVNIKVMQETLGHASITTTMDIYADVTKELKRDEFSSLNSYFSQAMAPGSTVTLSEN